MQALIDGALAGATVTIPRGRYMGAVKIDKPLTINAIGVTIQSSSGPALVIDSADVSVRGLTVIAGGGAPGSLESCAMLVRARDGLVLRDVRVVGEVIGLDGEEGEWVLPASVDFGSIPARSAHRQVVDVVVPVDVWCSTSVDGVVVEPRELRPGPHTLTLELEPTSAGALIIGDLLIQTRSLIRAIPVRGTVVLGPPSAPSIDDAPGRVSNDTEHNRDEPVGQETSSDLDRDDVDARTIVTGPTITQTDDAPTWRPSTSRANVLTNLVAKGDGTAPETERDLDEAIRIPAQHDAILSAIADGRVESWLADFVGNAAAAERLKRIRLGGFDEDVVLAATRLALVPHQVVSWNSVDVQVTDESAVEWFVNVLVLATDRQDERAAKVARMACESRFLTAVGLAVGDPALGRWDGEWHVAVEEFEHEVVDGKGDDAGVSDMQVAQLARIVIDRAYRDRLEGIVRFRLADADLPPERLLAEVNAEIGDTSSLRRPRTSTVRRDRAVLPPPRRTTADVQEADVTSGATPVAGADAVPPSTVQPRVVLTKSASPTTQPVSWPDDAPSRDATIDPERRRWRFWTGTALLVVIGLLLWRPVTSFVGGVLERPPENDDFREAIRLRQASGTVQASNVLASVEAGEPRHVESSDASIWFAWIAPSESLVTFDTVGSSIATSIAIYQGTSVNRLTRVVVDDGVVDDVGAVQASFTARTGSSYRVVVSDRNGSQGDITLNWTSWTTRARGDDFSGALEIRGGTGSAAGSTVGSSREAGEPVVTSGVQPSVWFSWTPERSGSYTFTTAGSSFDTVLAVFSGSRLSDLVRLNANDDASGGLTSTVQFRAQVGTTYKVMVTGFEGATGSFVLSWSLD